MKKIVFFCIFINIMIFLTVAYTLFINNNKTETLYLTDVSNLLLDDALKLLTEYEVEIIEIDSEEPGNMVLYTVPSKNRLTYQGQTIKVYISSGILIEYFKDLINKYYIDNFEYLEYLVNEYNINLVVEEVNNNSYDEGLIINQSTYGEIQENIDFFIEVNCNKSVVLVPSFINRNYKVAQQFFIDKNVKVIYIFTQSIFDKDIIFSQSIDANTLVLINSNPIYFYVSTGIGD